MADFADPRETLDITGRRDYDLFNVRHHWRHSELQFHAHGQTFMANGDASWMVECNLDQLGTILRLEQTLTECRKEAIPPIG